MTLAVSSVRGIKSGFRLVVAILGDLRSVEAVYSDLATRVAPTSPVLDVTRVRIALPVRRTVDARLHAVSVYLD